MGELGNYYHRQYEDGNREVIGVLTAEEANLLHACQLARTYGWWNRVISTPITSSRALWTWMR